jgi:hypothetical protein
LMLSNCWYALDMCWLLFTQPPSRGFGAAEM